MDNLALLGLTTRTAKRTTQHEIRIEVRFLEGDSFIAWFQKNSRVSNGEHITSITTQFVRRSELTAPQILAIETWLLERIREHV
jgi:hypothetical protein